MSGIESEMMDEWRRTRYIKAAGPPDRSDPQPTLTAAEREALLTVRDIYASHDDDDSCAGIAAAIDGLLERLGGGR